MCRLLAVSCEKNFLNHFEQLLGNANNANVLGNENRCLESTDGYQASHVPFAFGRAWASWIRPHMQKVASVDSSTR